ncbi:MAG TPA: LD-carboxypeptidase [Chloroflexota bacterium]|nr:LD-carboxypeptidase [Chloroflexota bacterium]
MVSGDPEARRGTILRPGDTVAVIAPASPIDVESLEEGLEVLRRLGFRPRLGPGVLDGRGYLAGASDQERADQLTAAFADPSVAGILCARGGYGAMRLLDRIDWEVVRRNPKFFGGFSDITALHLAMNAQELVTFHAPMVGAGLAEPENAALLYRAMTSAEPLGRLPQPEGGSEILTLSHGKATGRLVGGNLTLLSTSLGTPWEIQTKGKVVLLEEVHELPYGVDRLLVHLLLAGKLVDAAGIVFGDSPTCLNRPDGKPSLTLYEVIEDLLIPLGIPLIYGYPCGHSRFRWTLPLNTLVTLDADEQSLTFHEPGLASC